MSDVIISVENLGKRYRIAHQQANGMRYKALRDVLTYRAKSAVRGPWSLVRSLWSSRRSQSLGPLVSGPLVPSREDFWALRDVSFEVKRGEVVGIIGRNGAGKSTLLKILSRITEPTEGRVRLKGRVASLLEVGTGFHPELTGRENIFLNGAILGMSKAEIKSKFDEIVAFAEVEKFLDTPVKRYSSGMYVRLAFAVAAHLEPEVLIVDEVLAVGDNEFQRKCLGKMERVARSEGRTVLFVSHNMAAVSSLCTSGAFLSNGRLINHGPTSAIVQTYLAGTNREGSVPLTGRKDRQGTGAMRFLAVELADGGGKAVSALQCGADASLVLRFDNAAQGELRNVSISIGVDSSMGQRVLLLDSAMVGEDFLRVPPGEGEIRISIPKLGLLPGLYRFTIFATVNGVIADWIKDAAGFEVEGGNYFGSGVLPAQGQGVFVTPHSFRYEPAAQRWHGSVVPQRMAEANT